MEYISREAARDEFLAISRRAYNDGCIGAGHDAETAARVAMEDIPAADVAPVVHARWDDFGEESTWECSNCHEPYILIEGTPKENNYNYCPNCGARMDGGTDNEQPHE